MSIPLAQLTRRIHALLFAEGGSLTIKQLMTMTSASAEETSQALDALSARLAESGLMLMRSERDVTLAATPEESAFLREYYTHTMNEDIGDAGLEVLSLIAYRPGISKSDIDFVRGVNSAMTLRNLTIRGLIERAYEDKTVVYRPTPELFAYLGVRSAQELPEYAEHTALLGTVFSRIPEHDTPVQATGQ